MRWIIGFLKSPVGQKQVMALTGLGLSLFVVIHMLGNLLIWIGPGPYNQYMHSQVDSFLIWPERLVLFTAFLFHVVLAMKVNRQNQIARKDKYKKGLLRNGEGTLASRLMPVTGILTLIYVVVHVYTMTIAAKTGTYVYKNTLMVNNYSLVMDTLKDPAYGAFYILGTFAVGFHLYHGFQSMFRTFGFYHLQITPFLGKFSKVLGLVVWLGYASIPVYAFIKGNPQLFR